MMTRKEHRLLYAVLFALLLHALLFTIPTASRLDTATTTGPLLRATLLRASETRGEPTPKSPATKTADVNRSAQPTSAKQAPWVTSNRSREVAAKKVKTGAIAQSAASVTEVTGAGKEIENRVMSQAGSPDTERSTAVDRTTQASEAKHTLLTKLLHEAIARSQRYPTGARRMGREGVAQVVFLLTPDGEVVDLQLAQTSGSGTLDRAALRAVARIAPFRPASAMLASSERFAVEVVFRIN